MNILKYRNIPFADTFRVTIEQNEDAKILSLSGDYWLTVSPDIISIKSLEDSSIQEWNLNFIKRFFMDKHDVNILIIETGSYVFIFFYTSSIHNN